MDLGVM